MENEYNNRQWNELEEIFWKLEPQIIDLSCNMAIFMKTIENKFGHFKDFGGSNLQYGLDEKYRDNKDPKMSQKKS